MPRLEGFIGDSLRQVRRVVLTFLAIAFTVFAVPRAMPGDPLQMLVDPDSGSSLSMDEIVYLREYYGLDRSYVKQFTGFLGNLASGDLGWSTSFKEPVSTVLKAHLAWTAVLVFPALILSTLIGFAGGVNAAWRRGRAADRILSVVSAVARSLPDYAIAWGFLLLGGALLGWFPLAGGREPFTDEYSVAYQLFDVARHAVLPVSALTVSIIGSKFLLARNSMVSVLGQDYVLLARAEGIPERRIKYKHASRNAAVPFLSQFALQVGFAVSGAVFIESVFSYPGMGSLVLEAVSSRDYSLVEGCFLTLAGIVLAANFIAELTIRRLDPRKAL